MNKPWTSWVILVATATWVGQAFCFSSQECSLAKLEIRQALESSQAEDQINAFRQILLCRNYEDLGAVIEALDDEDRMVSAAAAMTLAMAGRAEDRDLLVDKYINCPSSPECPTDLAYLRAAVIVACSSPQVGLDPLVYELPKAPIEMIDERCVKRVRERIPSFRSEPSSQASPEGLFHPSPDPSNKAKVLNFIKLAERSGSRSWLTLMEPCLTSPDGEVRRVAAIALTHFDPQVSHAYFTALFADDNPTVRRIAVVELGQEACESTERVLRGRLDVEEDLEVRQSLRLAVEGILTKQRGCPAVT